MKIPYIIYLKERHLIYHIFMFLHVNVLSLNNGKKNLGKFNSKFDEGIYLGCSSIKSADIISNMRTLLVEELIHLSFDE